MKINLLTGSYQNWDSPGICILEIDGATGKLLSRKTFIAGKNPSYLALDKANGTVFVVNECADYDNSGHGAITVGKLDHNGDFSFLHRFSSKGALPAHCLFIPELKILSIANYGSGSVVFFSMEHSEAEQEIQFFQGCGSGPVKDRQGGPHMHQTIAAPDKKFLFAVDLGTDTIHAFKVKKNVTSALVVAEAYKTHSGWGPRHLVFHPDGTYAYLVHELKAMVSVLRYSADSGLFEELEAMPTIPASYTGRNKCAAILLSPDARFLYLSNRGHDSIATFAVDAQTKLLQFLEFIPAEGQWPRDFTIDRSGKFLIAANKKSDNITVFHRDLESGRLSYTGWSFTVPQPAFVHCL